MNVGKSRWFRSFIDVIVSSLETVVIVSSLETVENARKRIPSSGFQGRQFASFLTRVPGSRYYFLYKYLVESFNFNVLCAGRVLFMVQLRVPVLCWLSSNSTYLNAGTKTTMTPQRNNRRLRREKNRTRSIIIIAV
jgi:hypothetical protein